MNLKFQLRENPKNLTIVEIDPIISVTVTASAAAHNRIATKIVIATNLIIIESLS